MKINTNVKISKIPDVPDIVQNDFPNQTLPELSASFINVFLFVRRVCQFVAAMSRPLSESIL